MKSLKSLFISSYLAMIIVVSGYGGWRLLRGADSLAWGGVLLTVAPTALLILWFMAFKDTARTSAHLPLWNALGLVGIALTFVAADRSGAVALAPLFAVAGWLGFLAYVYWYSTFNRPRSASITIGEPLPNFVLVAASGARVTSADLLTGPTVLMFYRGNWCPLCMAQIKELAQRYNELAGMGVRVALVSPQPHDKTVELARRFGVDFEFLTDEDNAAARTLGIAHPGGLPAGMQVLGYDSDTVLPTVVITDRAGHVVWTHETDNYRVRPEPDVFLTVLRRHGMISGAR